MIPTHSEPTYILVSPALFELAIGIFLFGIMIGYVLRYILHDVKGNK